MRAELPTARAAASYEFRMQVRRPALWIVMGLFAGWGALAFGQLYLPADEPRSAAQAAAGWAVALQSVLPLAAGLLMADRLPRDRRLNVAELLHTTPGSPTARLLGKYLGSLTATALPMLGCYLLLIAAVSIARGPAVLAFGALAFATITVPGLLFVTSFSLVVPSLLSTPIYMVLFVGYWIWGNLLNPSAGLPTLNGTWLTPLGEHAAAGLFGVDTVHVGAAGLGDAIASVGLLVGLAAAILVAGDRYLSWRRAGPPAGRATPALGEGSSR